MEIPKLIKKNPWVMIILSIIFGATIIDAWIRSNTDKEANSAYSSWANSPAGISIRRLQREAYREQQSREMQCWADHAGPDYDVTLDCPENLKEAPQFEKYPPLAPRSLWNASWPYRFLSGRYVLDDAYENLNNYWLNKDQN